MRTIKVVPTTEPDGTATVSPADLSAAIGSPIPSAQPAFPSLPSPVPAMKQQGVTPASVVTEVQDASPPMPWDWYPTLGIRTVRWKAKQVMEQVFASIFFPLSLPFLCCIRGRKAAQSMFYWFSKQDPQLSTVHNFMTMAHFFMCANVVLVLGGYISHMADHGWQITDAYTSMLSLQVLSAIVVYIARRAAYGVAFAVLPSDSYLRLTKGQFLTRHTLMCFASPNDPEATAHLITLGAAAKAGINIIEPVFTVRKAYFLQLRECLSAPAIAVLEKILYRAEHRRPDDLPSVYSIGDLPFIPAEEPSNGGRSAQPTESRRRSGFEADGKEDPCDPLPKKTPLSEDAGNVDVVQVFSAATVELPSRDTAKLVDAITSPTGVTPSTKTFQQDPQLSISVPTSPLQSSKALASAIVGPVPQADADVEVLDLDETIEVPYYDILVLLWTEGTEVAWKGISGAVLVSMIMVLLILAAQLISKAIVFHNILGWTLTEAFFGQTAGARVASGVLLFQDLASLLFILSHNPALIFASNKRVTQAVAHMVRQICSLQLVEERRLNVEGSQVVLGHHRRASNPWDFLDDYDVDDDVDGGMTDEVHTAATGDTPLAGGAQARGTVTSGSTAMRGEGRPTRVVTVTKSRNHLRHAQSTKDTMARWMTSYAKKGANHATFNDLQERAPLTTLSKRAPGLTPADDFRAALPTSEMTVADVRQETIEALKGVPLEATGDPPAGYFGIKFAAIPPCIRLDDADNLNAFVHCVMNTQRCFDCSLGYMMSTWVLLTFSLLVLLGVVGATLTALQLVGTLQVDASQWLGMLGPTSASTIMVAFQGTFAFLLFKENWDLQHAQEKNAVFLRYHAWDTTQRLGQLLAAPVQEEAMSPAEIPSRRSVTSVRAPGSPIDVQAAVVSSIIPRIDEEGRGLPSNRSCRASFAMDAAMPASWKPPLALSRPPTGRQDEQQLSDREAPTEQTALLPDDSRPRRNSQLRGLLRKSESAQTTQDQGSRLAHLSPVRLLHPRGLDMVNPAGLRGLEPVSSMLPSHFSRQERVSQMSTIAREQELCAARVQDYCNAHPYKMFGINPSPVAARSIFAGVGTIVVLGIRLVSLFWSTRA